MRERKKGDNCGEKRKDDRRNYQGKGVKIAEVVIAGVANRGEGGG